MPRVRLGCEVFLDDPPQWVEDLRLGLLANQASVTGDLIPVGEAIQKMGFNLVSLFSPQHGYYSEKQANMVESPDQDEPVSGMRIYSLYGSVRQPTREMLSSIDVLLVDLQDVGTRVYTYATTAGLCMEKAAETKTKIVVLDRPNPINGVDSEGNLLRPDHRSFVGRYSVPMRHGLTMGELMRYAAAKYGIECNLDVVTMRGWKRSSFFPDTGLAWVFPSPNMPAWESALLYPGMVLLEGTNVSEGRGTTLPFQLVGAPFVDPERVLSFLDGHDLQGLHLRPLCFEPTFDKWRGEVCSGFQIHVLDPARLKPYRFGLALLRALFLAHPDDVRWLPPPYEYEYEKIPIDILIGDKNIRKRIESGEPIVELEKSWERELLDYRQEIKGFFLY